MATRRDTSDSADQPIETADQELAAAAPTGALDVLQRLEAVLSRLASIEEKLRAFELLRGAIDEIDSRLTQRVHDLDARIKVD